MNEGLFCLLRSSYFSHEFNQNFSTKPAFFQLNHPKTAFLIRANSVVDLVLGQKLPDEPLKFLAKNLSKSVEQTYMSKDIEVLILFYEYGNLIQGLPIDENTILGVCLSFDSASVRPWLPMDNITLKADSLVKPNYAKYKEQFQSVQKELVQGNSYQVNLTSSYELKLSAKPLELASVLFRRDTSQLGECANAFWLPSQEQFYISNTPELLFEVKRDDDAFLLETRPIKGTRSTLGTTVEQARASLEASDKEQAELFMISDLLRNDLSKISTHRSRVVSKKKFFTVPGIVHQFSELNVKIEKTVCLNKIVESLFPGGSITGAPKKSTSKIIKETEGKSREYYCGSTLVAGCGSIKASINIRAGNYSLAEGLFRVFAGGGITVQSECQSEFQEMESKFLSFAGEMINY